MADDEKVTEIEQDLAIDKDALDFECMDQPRKYIKWSVRYAGAVKDRDEAKRLLQVKRSELSYDIRSRPALYGVEKVTEGSVTSTLDTLPEVIDATQNVEEHSYVVNIYQAAREAFEQRKSMIENLVKLYISGYFSAPKVGGEDARTLADAGTQQQKEFLKKRIQLKGGNNQ